MHRILWAAADSNSAGQITVCNLKADHNVRKEMNVNNIDMKVKVFKIEPELSVMDKICISDDLVSLRL